MTEPSTPTQGDETSLQKAQTTQAADPVEVRGCPFCGGMGRPYLDARDLHGVGCTRCLASIGVHETFEDAISRWNARPEPDCRALAVKLAGALSDIAFANWGCARGEIGMRALAKGMVEEARKEGLIP
jgi:hypothetical protein